ncbi:MAG: hypothetical protein L3V56_14880 [Candidatus Magnetoovum sp. WYHC-5]|nr:hypothetical protein [Candidatus Magnetoovum sp. WYHC-5]
MNISKYKCLSKALIWVFGFLLLSLGYQNTQGYAEDTLFCLKHKEDGDMVSRCKEFKGPNHPNLMYYCEDSKTKEYYVVDIIYDKWQRVDLKDAGCNAINKSTDPLTIPRGD